MNKKATITAESVTESVKALARLYDEPKPPARKLILEDAIRIICNDRNISYAEPMENLTRTASLLNAFFRGRSTNMAPDARHYYTADDVAAIGIIIKLGRLAHAPDHRDTWEDIAGYAAIGWECAEKRIAACAVQTEIDARNEEGVP